MMAFFYIMLFLSILGAILGSDNFRRWAFYTHPNHTHESYNTTPRIWIAVKTDNSRATKIKVKFLGNPALELAKDIEICSDGNIIAESWHGYSYREILESLTPDQVKAVNELRSFLK